MENRNHRCVLVVRPKDVVLDLIQGISTKVYLLPEKSGSSKFYLMKDILIRNILLLKLRIKHRISWMIGTDLSIAQIARITGAKSVVVNEDDAEAVPLFSNTAYPLASKILVPIGCSTGKFEAKTIRYNGYHELAYLHPDHFKPDVSVLQKNQLEPYSYVVMRFSALNAHHDTGVEGIDDQFALRIIDELSGKYRVIITSERVLSPELEPYRMQFHPSQMHDVLSYAKLFIGDSQTMAAESMVLGRPSIRCNDFVGRLAYLEELENVYNLGFGILPSNREEIIVKLKEIVGNDQLESQWAERNKKMLAEKINVADYWTDLFIDLASK